MTTDIDSFVALVKRYLTLVDRSNDATAHTLLQSCALLPRIYAAGAELPDVEPTDEELPGEVDSPLPCVRRLLGRYDSYSEIFDPYVDDPAVVASLADDLADVYLDLARPLGIYEAGREADAVWKWRSNLRGHCGDHLVDAMRAIHRAVNSHMPPEYIAGDETAG
jgi:hypothetical protein